MKNPARFTTLKEKLASGNFKADSFTTSLPGLLSQSEACLISYMKTIHKWIGDDQTPSSEDPCQGYIEFGIYLYLIWNPSLLLNDELQDIAEILQDLNNWFPGYVLPPTNMTSENYNVLNTENIVYLDGSILSTVAGSFDIYDQNWLYAVYNLFYTSAFNAWYSGSTFNNSEGPTVALSDNGSKNLSLALISDWGTGLTVAQNVMAQLASTNPDYILHLGDVYYSGSPLNSDYNFFFNLDNNYPYSNPAEEQDNLLNQWPSGFSGKSFTLNSNHEMYTGANGYFIDALQASNDTPGGIFSAQQGSSYFLLTYGDWNLLCLDSAYPGDETTAFMDGDIEDRDFYQPDWINNLGLDASKTIVFTHHNALQFDGSAVTDLFSQVQNQLNAQQPYAWYWGHVHYAVAYNQQYQVNAQNVSTYMRCLGHGALPFGQASGLSSDIASYYSGINNEGNENYTSLLSNGFVTLDFRLNDSNSVTSIWEHFYDTSSLQQPVWSNQIFQA